MQRSRRRNAQQWQGLIDEQLQSGLSAPKFCTERGIGYPSFSAVSVHLPDWVSVHLPDWTGAYKSDLSGLS